MNLTEEIRFEAVDGIAVVTIDRPQARNAINNGVIEGLRQAWQRLAADDALRVGILTGSGDKAFCAGMDLKQAAATGLRVPPRDMFPVLNDVVQLHKPVIAAVNGVAAGAGANFALGCDLTVAARSASFIQAFSKIALVPDCGGTWWLPRLVGRQRAMGLAMLGDKLSAEQAAAWGLIWQCVDDAELGATVAALAARLAAMPSRALVETRRAFDAAAGMGYDEALVNEGRLQSELGRANDYVEGVTAFFAKRAPTFTDR